MGVAMVTGSVLTHAADWCLLGLHRYLESSNWTSSMCMFWTFSMDYISNSMACCVVQTINSFYFSFIGLLLSPNKTYECSLPTKLVR